MCNNSSIFVPIPSCTLHHIPVQYKLLKKEGADHQPVMWYSCETKYGTTTGQAGSVKEAQNKAADQMMSLIKGIQAANHTAASPATCVSPGQLMSPGSPDNPIGSLDELMRKVHCPLASYSEAQSVGPSHAPDFSLTCTTPFGSTGGQGSSVKAAKRDAAIKMLTLVGKNRNQLPAGTAASAPQPLVPDLLPDSSLSSQQPLPANFSS